MATLQEKALAAIRHVLNRVQLDPEFRWHMLHTESLEKLIAVEAEALGIDPAEHGNSRTTDAQPTYRHRRPECELNRDRVSDLERLLEERGIDYPPRER